MFHLWGFVFMPDHVHLVLLPQPDVKISQILASIKSSVSKRAILWVKRNTPTFLKQMEDAQPNGIVRHRFWQRGGGYDRNLRSVADVREKIRYVHENPVRRGLVTSADQWHWSSYVAWETGQDCPIPLDRESLMR